MCKMIAEFLFVYGSLRAGQANHHILRNLVQSNLPLDGPDYSESKESVQTKDDYRMFGLSSRSYPFLVTDDYLSGTDRYFLTKYGFRTSKIVGEIYRIEGTHIWNALDAFEGNEYERKQIEIEKNGTVFIADAYVASSFISEEIIANLREQNCKYEFVEGGNWAAYLSTISKKS
jgi:gamma-glutamylcyclotransferase (GGCT)/AIG2-like uncharacterized protein YtfP